MDCGECPALRARVRELEAKVADAWDEGHNTRKLADTEPPFCECFAFSESECACGNYGRTIAAPNPYRIVPEDLEPQDWPLDEHGRFQTNLPPRVVREQ